jgi:holin-like protein
VLLLFRLLGDSMVFLTGLAVPGPVVGLVLLFLALQAGKGLVPAARAPVEQAADGLLGNLGLFCVPAGVGVVALWGLVQVQAVAIAVVLVVSAVLTLGRTVWTLLLVRHLVCDGKTR